MYFPAIVAKNHNPIIMTFCERLKEKGKHNMAIVGAAMRKLLHIVFGVLSSKKAFDRSGCLTASCNFLDIAARSSFCVVINPSY